MIRRVGPVAFALGSVGEDEQFVLNDMVDKPIPAALEKARRRHLMPGAATSDRDFQVMFEACGECVREDFQKRQAPSNPILYAM